MARLRVLLRNAKGSQLVEFAVVLPLLLVFAVGISDLSAGLILRDKLTNAAREGARLAIGQPTSDLTNSDPSTVEQVAAAVLAYMNSAGISGTLSACAAGTSASSWVCNLSNGGAITIERQFPVSSGSAFILCTRITVAYPYQWTLSQAANLLGGTIPGSFTISTQSVMRNLT